MKVTIYHNPRCSKSRQTLQLLQEQGIEPEIIKYLETPLSAEEISSILTKLAIEPRALLRKSEPDYKSAGLNDTSLDSETLIRAMAEHPKLIERPIVLANNKAAIGRPPENVLTIL
jgi:arsenate reductase (glutaredoxin)